MPKSRSKVKGRKAGGSFLSLPHSLLNCANYKSLSHYARSLLIDLAAQYNGKNNGNLSIPASYLKARGWRSSQSTIHKAKEELIYYGFIVLTQKGGFSRGSTKRPNLFAITWMMIDKVEYSDGYSVPTGWKEGDLPRLWREDKPEMPKQTKVNKKSSVLSEYRAGTPRVVVSGNFSQK